MITQTSEIPERQSCNTKQHKSQGSHFQRTQHSRQTTILLRQLSWLTHSNQNKARQASQIVYILYTCTCTCTVHVMLNHVPGEEALYTTSPASSLHSGMTVWHRANTLKKWRIVELLESYKRTKESVNQTTAYTCLYMYICVCTCKHMCLFKGRDGKILL